MQHEKQFYIDGDWVDPVDAEARSTSSIPSTEEAFAQIALGSARPTSTRPWPPPRPPSPTFARSHAARSGSRCCSASSKSTRSATPRSPMRSRRRWARRCSSPTRPRPRPAWPISTPIDRGAGELSSSRRCRARPLIAREPIGVVRPDHAVELADQPDRLQGRAGARRRLHHGAEAVRDRAAQRHHLRRGHARGRRAEGRVQPGQRRRRRRSARRCRRIPTSTWCRSPARPAPASGRQGGRRHGQARAQELGGKSANIMLDDADLADGRRQAASTADAQQRPVLQRADAHARAARAARRGDGHRQGGGRAASIVGDPTRADDQARPGRQRDPVRQDPAPDRGRHRRRRDAGRPAVRAGRSDLEPRLLRAARPCSPTSPTT